GPWRVELGTRAQSQEEPYRPLSRGHPGSTDLLDQQSDQFDGRRVAPVQVFHREHDGPLLRHTYRERNQGGQHELLLTLGCDGEWRKPSIGRVLEEARKERHRRWEVEAQSLEERLDRFRQCGEQLRERSQRAALVLDHAATFQPIRRWYFSSQLTEQSRLADPRLARQQRDPWRPSTGPCPGLEEVRSLEAPRHQGRLRKPAERFDRRTLLRGRHEEDRHTGRVRRQ